MADEQDDLIRAYAERLDALAFEFWSEAEWNGDVPGILAMEPGDPRIRDHALRSAHKSMLRAVEELRLSISNPQAPTSLATEGRVLPYMGRHRLEQETTASS